MKFSRQIPLILFIPCIAFTQDFSKDRINVKSYNEEINSVEEQIEPLPQVSQEESCALLFDKYPSIYCPSAIHYLIAVSGIGDSLEFEDGSVWRISAYDRYKPLSWRANDPVMITQNHRWFSKYKYRIVNANTGSALEANLYLGPIQNGEHTRYIIAIDPVEAILMLSDHTHWEVSPYDRFAFRNWDLEDAVIIGYNSGWDSNSEALLINVNMNQSIRAKQF